MRRCVIIGGIIVSLLILLGGVVEFYTIHTKTRGQGTADAEKQKFKDKDDNTKRADARSASAIIKPKDDTLSLSDLVWEDISRGNLNLNTVLIPDDYSRIIYAGSDNALLKSEDSGQTWRTILFINGQNKAVNFLLTDKRNNHSLYAATGDGLFYSFNQGESWKKIFRGKSYLEKECTALAVLPSAIYLGTKEGLFISKDRGLSWHKQTGKLGKSHIFSITVDSNEEGYIYIASIHGVFRSKDSGQSWERVFIAQGCIKEDNQDDDEAADDQDYDDQVSMIRCIIIDPNNSAYLFLATDRGVYKSADKGSTWDLLSNCGLIDRDVQSLLISPDSVLYAVSKSAICRYGGEKRHVLSLGLEAGEIRSVALDKKGNLYASCDKGLFRSFPKTNPQEGGAIVGNVLLGYLKNEPGIDELHKAAVKYAEVEPEKVLRWRKQAAMSAWLPKLTVGMDRDKDKTVSSSIWGTYGTTTTSGKYYVGPDDETRDNNKNWSISLSWELGDLIWNDAQTSIDARSRLMVQLRNDILDEVTKLYFERIRVKMELDSLSIEDRKKRSEKELKLQELTAYLDGLTGNYFSSRIKGEF